MPYLAGAVLIDTSAAIALTNNKDQFHSIAKTFFNVTSDVLWVTMNATVHEAYTRVRYDVGFRQAIDLYDFLKKEPIYHLSFKSKDEDEARVLLERFWDHPLSFHDALCAVVMKRMGIYRAFTFDRHFYCFGFEVLPGNIY